MPLFIQVAFFTFCTCFALFLVSGCAEEPNQSQLQIDHFKQAQAALRRGEYKNVFEIVSQIPENSADWQAAQILAGEAATKNGEFKKAIKTYKKLIALNPTSKDGLLATFSIAEIYLELGQLSSAESHYKIVLKNEPGNLLTNERLAFLLSLSGRRWEALDHYFVLIKSGSATYRELALAADVGRSVEQHEFLEKCKRLAPADKIVRLSLATHAFSDGLETAQLQLESLVKDHPELLTAHAMLGEFYLEESKQNTFVNWYQSLPESAEGSPDIWFVRGQWARQQANLVLAADCFRQCLLRTPFHRRAMYALGQTLVAIEDPDSTEVLKYSELLIELSQSIDQVLVSEGKNPIAVRKCALTLEKLGRIWESCAWGIVGRELFPNAVWPNEIFSKYQTKLDETLPVILESRIPVAGQKVSRINEFDQLINKAMRAKSNDSIQKINSADSKIFFEEMPVIDFQYFNADDPETKGLRTFEQTGGGVAILDYDLDGFPDVFLSQGTEWETGSSTPTPTSQYQDQLHRNLKGTAFQNVSRLVFQVESGYGQGCSIGDFNNDGFPDLYVANVGRNRLYENMGDGTFLDVTGIGGLTDEIWTASVMVNDLNADGLPDIYDVNYLTGKDLYQKICKGRACSPSSFPGAPDRVHINQGDGTFRLLPDSLEEHDSKGLGIVAYEITQNRRPSVFIANDQVANFYFVNQPAQNDANLSLSNQALISGVAFNEDGLSMACMGVAVADFDQNNQLDIFVTNFLNESNTLYLQEDSHLFRDATKERGLQSNSLEFTSWGTQPLDADLDGDFDIVVVSGHVDDYRDVGGKYRMQPQFFENLTGHFLERKASEVGKWFDQEFLGRGLARVDLNRDGLPDFVVSNVNAPVSVIQNTTSEAGNYITVKLIATTTARDAIGARVTLQANSWQATQQLTAGDGYMASNERKITFGLGQQSDIEKLIVAWPSGSRSVIDQPAINSEILLIEDSPIATVCHNSDLKTQICSLTKDNRER